MSIAYSKDSYKDINIFILNISLFPVPLSSAKLIQMKPRKIFFQSNRCIDIDTILKNMEAAYKTAV